MRLIQIYCDGGCRGNQNTKNIGGYGFVIHEKETHEGWGIDFDTTNNRMELTACIKALNFTSNIVSKKTPIHVYTDSLYLVRGINEWHKNWLRKGWINSKGKPVENRDLWERLLFLADHFNDIRFTHVRGHADNEGNNRADYLVNLAMDEYLESQ